MPTSLIVPVATAGIQYGASKLMESTSKGGGSSGKSFTPTGISAGGLESSFDGSGRIQVGSNAERMGLVRGLQENFGGLSGQLGLLRQSVAPGMSDLRKSRLGEIENARTAAVGNLRENLARRRVLGSSFGQDAITRAESEFAGQRDRVAAESFLQELELTNQLVTQEYDAGRRVFQTGLDELNLQADIGLKLAGAATQQLGAMARTEAELNAKEAAGAGKFFGEIMGPVAKAGGNAFGSLFSGGGGGGGFYGGSPATNPNLVPF